jgi:hypothetical protein
LPFPFLVASSKLYLVSTRLRHFIDEIKVLRRIPAPVVRFFKKFPAGLPTF